MADLQCVRQCAQEIISAHVIEQDTSLRDRLITEYASAHERLLDVIYAFVQSHVVETVVPQAEIAEDRFAYMLDASATLLQLMGESIGVSPSALAPVFLEAHLESVRDLTGQGARAVTLAAQTCLAVHISVRRGQEPLGIQRHLDLDDMCAVVQELDQMVQLLLRVVVARVGQLAVIEHLLDHHIERILQVQAVASGVSVSAHVRRYWEALADRDVRFSG
ncbi:hypothetical protein [Phytoactinopolyspora mesophila]|uniref:Uncharacterized protein n=1 Tax=Phytoactinopolyspora mesophila TaxID=2650750 RepID=A0A7K3MCU2_9ACTN|nr:hypothetical protein [Phytoactinopolyspora mesophila]NDL61145.1 hypothetical protein [Phytoactinopolyspora mesophila]